MHLRNDCMLWEEGAALDAAQDRSLQKKCCFMGIPMFSLAEAPAVIFDSMGVMHPPPSRIWTFAGF